MNQRGSPNLTVGKVRQLPGWRRMRHPCLYVAGRAKGLPVSGTKAVLWAQLAAPSSPGH
jgi:hypothetical protein